MQLQYILILICVFAVVTQHLSKRSDSVVVDEEWVNDEEADELNTTGLFDGLDMRKQENLRNTDRVSSEVLEDIIEEEKRTSDEHTRAVYATLSDKQETHGHRQQFGNDDKTRMWLTSH